MKDHLRAAGVDDFDPSHTNMTPPNPLLHTLCRQKIFRFLILAGRPVGRVEGVVLPRPPTCDGGLKAFGPSGDGVEAVLACMERHQSNSQVQAVACWSLVNLALIPQQKRALCRRGGVLAIVRAMACHPQDSEVHFRAMFALINLVTPDVTSERIINPDTMQVRHSVCRDGGAPGAKMVVSSRATLSPCLSVPKSCIIQYK